MLRHLSESVQKYWYGFIGMLPRLGLALVVVIGGILLAGWISGLFRRRIASKAHDPLMGRFLGKTIRVALIIVVCMIGLHAAGLSGIAGGILATAGASAIVIGFAFKDIAENFIAGIILAFNRPFHVDETIQIDQTFGKVKDMAFRYTQIQTFDGREVYIPNADVLKKPVINFTGNGFYRLEFVVGIAYESAIDQAMELIQHCLDGDEGVVHDDQHVNFVTEDNLSASAVDLKVFFWVTTDDYRRGALITRGRLIRSVKERFDKAGIYMPCNVQEVKTYGPAGTMEVRTAAPKEQ
jgi:small conductance mechanosensitive channel